MTRATVAERPSGKQNGRFSSSVGVVRPRAETLVRPASLLFLDLPGMPIDVACSACGKKYRVPDNLAGKAAKCQACGAMMRIGGGASGSGAAPALAAPGRPAAAPQRPAAPRPAAAQPDPFGLGALGSAEDPFGSAPLPPGFDPLGAPVVQDFGFAQPLGEAEPTGPAMPTSQYSENPVVAEQRRLAEEAKRRWGGASDNPYMREAEAALGGPVKGKPGGKKGAAADDDPHSSYDGIVQVINVVCFVLGAGAIIAAAISPGVGFVAGIIVYGAAFVASSVGGIWALVLAFIISARENAIWKGILYLLCGIYQLIFWFQNWREMKTPVNLILGSIVTAVLAAVAFVIAGMRAAGEAQ